MLITLTINIIQTKINRIKIIVIKPYFFITLKILIE